MNKLILKNRRAYFEYEILEKFTTGIVLVGTEVKSIRLGNISIQESFCFISNNDEIFIKGMHIAPHKESSNHYNHDPIRDRKLLMNKKEIIKLRENVQQKGLTIVPLAIILSDTNYIKVEIGLARGKHTYDKSKALKEKDIKRDLERSL